MVEIVDESDRLVPTGKIGRVRVSTAGGPTSYLNDEAATRAFFKDGFFYSGDLAVMRSDGRMALQGRFTDVINVRGAKISPAPIEDRLGELFGSAASVCSPCRTTAARKRSMSSSKPRRQLILSG